MYRTVEMANKWLMATNLLFSSDRSVRPSEYLGVFLIRMLKRQLWFKVDQVAGWRLVSLDEKILWLNSLWSQLYCPIIDYSVERGDLRNCVTHNREKSSRRSSSLKSFSGVGQFRLSGSNQVNGGNGQLEGVEVVLSDRALVGFA